MKTYTPLQQAVALWWMALGFSIIGLVYFYGQYVEGRHLTVANNLNVTKVRFEPNTRKVIFQGFFDKVRDCKYRQKEGDIVFLVTYLVDANGGLHRGAVSFGDQPKNAPPNRALGRQHFYEWKVQAGKAAKTVTGLLVEVQHNCHPFWWSKSYMQSENDLPGRSEELQKRAPTFRIFVPADSKINASS